jgi:Ca-activated chloride channel family protein
MKFRPLVASVGIAALLALAACGGGPGGNATAPDRAPDSASGNERSRPTTSASQAPDDEQDTTRAQISTFALDVDTASYAYARRTLGEGRWPEPGQIRPEEFVNSFRQDYAEPSGDGFAVHVDGARLGTCG